MHHFSHAPLAAFCLIITLIGVSRIARDRSERLKGYFLILLTAGTALIGARLLHAIIEKPELWKDPVVILTKYDGMTFNGSLLLGGMTFYAGLMMFPSARRGAYWDFAAIMSAFSYGLLRIGCFAAGCCWGKISAIAWSVKYSDSPFMPWLGLPVHPVQLYDAVAGFGTFTLLSFLAYRGSRLKGRLFPLFLALYSVGRFITEMYRGDSIRGEEIMGRMSTSQLVSIGILSVLTIRFAFAQWRSRRRLGKCQPHLLTTALSRSWIVAITSLLTGCIWPQPPKASLFQSVTVARPGLELIQSHPPRSRSEGGPTRRGNAIFLTADSYIYQSLADQTKALTNGKPSASLDDLVWWEYAPLLTQVYSSIARITISEAKYETLIATLERFDGLDQPFDVFLLSHGMPNHLSSGEGYFISYRELALLKGRFKNLNLVFMQSCYGSTLAQDWLQAGARSVISFSGVNRNFFWISFFLRWYRFFDLKESYRMTNQSLDFSLRNEFLYLGLLQALGTTPDEYLKSVESPELVTQSHMHMNSP